MDVINCIFSSDDKFDYTTVMYNNKIVVYCGCDLILEFGAIETLTGAVYVNNILYFTKDRDNSIYFYNEKKQESKITLSEFKNIKLLKYINYTNQWFVLEVEHRKTIAYDLHNKIEILDRLKLIACYDNWDDRYRYTVMSDKKMKIPLYTGKGTDEKAISAHGKFVIYYSDESKRIVISKYQDGTIYRIFILPNEFTKKAKFYFNENTNIITIFDNDYVEQYIIEQSDQEIDRLNNLHKQKTKR